MLGAAEGLGAVLVVTALVAALTYAATRPTLRARLDLTEGDTFTLSDEYQRDRVARPDTVRIPENYFPDDDPAKTPRNSWRAYAHLLVSNWINETYQHTPFTVDQIGRKPDQSLGSRRGLVGRAKEGSVKARRR